MRGDLLPPPPQAHPLQSSGGVSWSGKPAPSPLLQAAWGMGPLAQSGRAFPQLILPPCPVESSLLET